MHAALVILLLFAIVAAGLCFYFLYSPAPKMPALAGSLQRSAIQVNGMVRTFGLYAPPDLPPGAPLLLVLHGQGLDGAKMRAWSGYRFDQLADLHGFAVAYPDGHGKSWNDYGTHRSTPAKRDNVDDVTFLHALVEHLARESGIAPSRVHAAGYSNGGQMGFRLLAERPGMLAGLAVAGANLRIPEDSLCTFDHAPPPLLLVSGTADRIIPHEGGQISLFGKRQFGRVRSSQDTARFFAALANAHEHRREPVRQQSDGTAVEMQAWFKDGRVAVESYTIHGGGHVLPQPVFRFPRIMGRTTQGLDMPAASIAFFGIQGPAI